MLSALAPLWLSVGWLAEEEELQWPLTEMTTATKVKHPLFNVLNKGLNLKQSIKYSICCLYYIFFISFLRKIIKLWCRSASLHPLSSGDGSPSGGAWTIGSVLEKLTSCSLTWQTRTSCTTAVVEGPALRAAPLVSSLTAPVLVAIGP